MNDHLLTFISWDSIKTSIKASTLALQPKHQKLIPSSRSPFLCCPTCGKHMVVTPKIPFRTNLALCPSFFTESPCGYEYGIHYSQLLKTLKKQLQAILSNETSTCLYLTATGVQITKEEQQPFAYLCHQGETRLGKYTETMETALEHLFY